MNRTLILGPPGTGKTTTLLNIVEKCFEDGLSPEELAFVSFTRKAAHEARDRAMARFSSLRQDQFPHFRTLHSLAYHRAGVRREQVMHGSHWKEVGKLCNMPMSFHFDRDDGSLPAGALEGDKYLFHHSLAHAKCVTWEQHYETLPHHERTDLEKPKFQIFEDQLRQYKSDMGVIDFGDMLDEAIPLGPLEGVRVAIVDEAQDLSRKQWHFVKALFPDVEQLFIAGDDDQAIYRWSGADLQTFLSLDGKQKVLDRSWRLPRQIWAYANQFTKRIKNRYDKQWGPDDRDGTVKFVTDPTQAPVGEGGEWLILLRNRYLASDIEEMCKNGGRPYKLFGQSSLKPAEVRVIQAWTHLQKGGDVSKKDAQAIYDFMKGVVQIKRGHKDLSKVETERFDMAELIANHGLLVSPDTNWFDALGRISLGNREHYRRVLRSGESLTDEPRISISTIHGIKGGEADNVLLLGNMAWRTYNEMEHNPEDEHRVWYVGATRARQNLYLVTSLDQNSYNFPTIPA